LSRQSVVEQGPVFAWLLNGHMTRTGKPLERPRLAPVEIARTIEGKPIYGWVRRREIADNFARQKVDSSLTERLRSKRRKLPRRRRCLPAPTR
jgi:hypothetical protein